MLASITARSLRFFARPFGSRPSCTASKVAIFWDWENFTPSNGSCGHAIQKNILRVAQGFGPVAQFKGYAEISGKSSTDTYRLRSELLAGGLSIIDCPHSNGKNVADFKIAADMMCFALDNPAPATIILISGDRDFACIVSSLRMRNYNIVLVVPPTNAHPTLMAQSKVASPVTTSAPSAPKCIVANEKSIVDIDLSMRATSIVSREVPVLIKPPPLPQFLPLVRMLKLLRNAGIARPSRGVVAAHLWHHHKSVFEVAEVNHFGSYALLAEKSGIVELGGGSASWICLCDAWLKFVETTKA